MLINQLYNKIKVKKYYASYCVLNLTTSNALSDFLFNKLMLPVCMMELILLMDKIYLRLRIQVIYWCNGSIFFNFPFNTFKSLWLSKAAANLIWNFDRQHFKMSLRLFVLCTFFFPPLSFPSLLLFHSSFDLTSWKIDEWGSIGFPS